MVQRKGIACTRGFPSLVPGTLDYLRGACFSGPARLWARATGQTEMATGKSMGYRFLLAIPLIVALAPAAGAPIKRGFESPPLVRAADVLPGHLLRSGTHRVHDDVETRGHYFHFSLETRWGVQEVASTAMLRVRVHEARTLAQAMNAFQVDEERLAVVARGQLHVGADSWLDILGSPVGTATELSSQLASNVGQTVSEINEMSSRRDDPRNRPPGGGDGTVLFAHKRNVASQLGLDVYSSNPAVQTFLDIVARERSSGRVGAGIATISLPVDGRTEVGGGAVEFRVRSRLKNDTPAELFEHNSTRLTEMGVNSRLRKRFLEHTHYSAKHQTVVTAYLDFLAGVGGRAVFFAAALAARNEVDALAFEQMARAFVSYHEGIAPLEEFRLAGRLPTAVSRDRVLVVVLPVDTIYWNKETAGMFKSLARYATDWELRKKEIIATGALTQAARLGAGDMSFNIRDRLLVVH